MGDNDEGSDRSHPLIISAAVVVDIDQPVGIQIASVYAGHEAEIVVRAVCLCYWSQCQTSCLK